MMPSIIVGYRKNIKTTLRKILSARNTGQWIYAILVVLDIRAGYMAFNTIGFVV
jgi:hypothetical protein